MPFDSAGRLYSPADEPTEGADMGEIEMQQLVVAHQSPRQSRASERLINDQVQEDDSDCPGERGIFWKLARSKLRWGVIQMPPEWYAEFEDEGGVEHLGFGVEEDNVQAPVPGRKYA